MADPYRAPGSPPPTPRDAMRTVLLATGALAGLAASVAVAFGAYDHISSTRASPTATVLSASATPAEAFASDDCTPQDCVMPRAYCPAGVAPSCKRVDGKCRTFIPAECGFEPPCPNGGIAPLCNPPEGAKPLTSETSVCDPPYTLDAKGHKLWKRDCM